MIISWISHAKVHGFLESASTHNPSRVGSKAMNPGIRGFAAALQACAAGLRWFSPFWGNGLFGPAFWTSFFLHGGALGMWLCIS